MEQSCLVFTDPMLPPFCVHVQAIAGQSLLQGSCKKRQPWSCVGGGKQ